MVKSIETFLVGCLVFFVPALEVLSQELDAAARIASTGKITARGADNLTGSLHDLYAKTAPAVVGVTCRRGRESYYGTGVFIDPTGLVLTSVTVVPDGARDIRVYLEGGRVGKAELLTAVVEKELSLLRLGNLSRLLRSGETGLPHLKLGDSTDVRAGEQAYTLGNAFQSIQDDDRVVLAAGLVSGVYELTKKRSEATYVGPTIETSAALNNGMDGGPLLNRRGEIIGLLSLNFSPIRWLGTTVPVNELKPIVARYRGWLDDRQQRFPVYAGLEIEVVGGRDIRVLRVRRGSPAARAGVRAGDTVIAVNGRNLTSLEILRRHFAGARPGDELELNVQRNGETLDFVVSFWGRF